MNTALLDEWNQCKTENSYLYGVCLHTVVTHTEPLVQFEHAKEHLSSFIFFSLSFSINEFKWILQVWSNPLSRAIISPSFSTKASSSTLELKSKSQLTEGEADAIKWLTRDSTI